MDAIVDLTPAKRADFGRRPLTSTHSLAQHELFTEEALIDLLDRFPRQHLYALTMGEDPGRDENRLAIHDGVGGAELLRAVKNGRLWLNITRVDRVEPAYRCLIDSLYAQLAAFAPHFKPVEAHGTLLISSPHVLVYYHADGPASVLWHLRGRKRLWVYPAADKRFIRQEHMEDIFAGVRHEYLPYEPHFDDEAVCYDLEPGQWAAWPQNAPHRVTNLDSVNVSLSTEHYTRESSFRARVYTANRFFRTRLGIKNLSVRDSGATALAKTLVHRTARKLGFDKLQFARHQPVLRVKADAPNGVVPLEVPGAPTAMARM